MIKEQAGKDKDWNTDWNEDKDDLDQPFETIQQQGKHFCPIEIGFH